MSQQGLVDFHGYDHVGLYYFEGLPFYAFYKNIGKSKNGNTVFARTLVAAIEVSGYNEYFESEKRITGAFPLIAMQAT